MPILVVMFLALVISALFLPGAGKGLEALFTNWDKLSDPSVWITRLWSNFSSHCLFASVSCLPMLLI